MKLASLKEGGRDGTLIVVNHELTRGVRAGAIAPTLQKAMDDWAAVSPRLAELAGALRDDKALALGLNTHAGEITYGAVAEAFPDLAARSLDTVLA